LTNLPLCGCSSPETDDNRTSAERNTCCGQEISGDFIPLEVVQDPQNILVYPPEELAQAPAEAVEIAMGCGNPLALAGLQPGEVVLDIGSGGGMDAFLSASRVGSEGRVIGVDMTPAMLERARRSAIKAGLDQVEFRQGVAEALPVEDATVDVVISNCVINLCEDKGQVFREAFRVLKPGGRLEVSDVLVNQPFPRQLSANPDEWAGCVYGALPEQEYLDLIAQAGFIDLQVRRSPGGEAAPDVVAYSAGISARKPQV
jgi:arsenite methyltransferase